MKITIENTGFVLAQNEVKVFPVILKADEQTAVMPKVIGVEGGCLQTCGRDCFGNAFENTLVLNAGEEKRLWFYIKAPLWAGETSFSIEIVNGTECIESCSLKLKTTEEIADETQFDDMYSLRRLVWLNSNRAIDDSIPTPFEPVSVAKRTVKILGREYVFNRLGLPANLRSYFTQGIKISENATEILSKDMCFCVDGQAFENRRLTVTENRDKAIIEAENESEDFIWSLQARVEFDGYIAYETELTAKRDIMAKVCLHLPINETCRRYFMGLGKDGGEFNGELNWKWNKEKQQDGFWVGAVNAGVKLQLKDENYRRPLVNIYYAHKPLLLPNSWYNGGKGGIRYENGEFIVYTGERNFKAGEKVRFDFALIITPLKEIDIKKQLNMRFYHKLDRQPNEWFDTAKAKGANIINVHHGNDLNPYINYPFFESEALGDFVARAHAEGIKVKTYYTVRELTVNAPEFSALRDFGHEIFEKRDESVNGEFWQGEAKDWIKENIGADVIPAWRQVLDGEKYKDQFDSAIITNGSSRLCNFYIEALNALLKRTDIDGLYVDDVAYGRETMRRVRKTLDTRAGRYIDFHTWNHNFNDFAGHASCLNLYTELLPYIDKLWIGEGFDYESKPDFWLVEMSGIPFGLMSEMLEADWQKVNPWKGLPFGMTTRLGWCEEADPTAIWQVFDKYRLEESEILGWWDEANAFISDTDGVLITEYRNENKSYLAVANYGEEDKTVLITRKDGKECVFYAPFIRNFQEESRLKGRLHINKGRGVFLVVED